MANDDHVAMLKQGVAAWNAWRHENANIRPDLSKADLRRANLSGANLRRAYLWKSDLGGARLSEADLREANLEGANLRKSDLHRADLREAKLVGANWPAHFSGADLREANLAKGPFGRAKRLRKLIELGYAVELSGATLSEADLSQANLSGTDLRNADLSRANLSGADLRQAFLGEADLSGANLSGADLRKAFLSEADLSGANLSGADLRKAFLSEANLSGANLSGADLSRADLQAAILVDTDLTGADLTGCCIYGISAWALKLERAKQQNLVITPVNEPAITVDNIEVAQFVYLLLHNEKIRNIIDTIGKKGVLLLGRFTEGRIQILERLREKLRSLGFVPMVFNFDKPETKDFTETVRLLANLSHFVIVDITNPRSAPLELQATVPDYMVPFVPILEEGQDPFAMFVDLQNKYDWVLEPVTVYPSVDRLIEVLENKIVGPAEAKFNQLLARRTRQLRVENV